LYQSFNPIFSYIIAEKIMLRPSRRRLLQQPLVNPWM